MALRARATEADAPPRRRKRSVNFQSYTGSMEDVPMLIWIGIAMAWVACLAVVVVLAARAPIMDEDPDLAMDEEPDLAERAERIGERDAWLKSRKRGASPMVNAHE